MTTREKLHRLVDELSEAEVQAALTRLERERAAIERWAEVDDASSVEDAWAAANAREAIREEPWYPAEMSAGSSLRTKAAAQSSSSHATKRSHD